LGRIINQPNFGAMCIEPTDVQPRRLPAATQVLLWGVTGSIGITPGFRPARKTFVQVSFSRFRVIAAPTAVLFAGAGELGISTVVAKL